MFNKICLICNKTFITKAHNTKTCSKECFVVHRKQRRIHSEKINKWTCKNCGCDFYRSRQRNGFCTKACASKYYIDNGSYNKWLEGGKQIALASKKPLVEQICLICNKTYHIKHKEAKRNRSKTCSTKCRRVYTAKLLSGENNHFWGKKYSKEWDEKRKITLKKKYGVDSAFALAKRRTKSKAQVDLYNTIKKAFINEVVQIEKMVLKEPIIFADIVFPKHKIIIEYNGDFWHYNPNKYNKDYFNPKKKLTAEEIWTQDEKRRTILEKEKYKVYTIWEADYKINKDFIIADLINKILREIGGT